MRCIQRSLRWSAIAPLLCVLSLMFVGSAAAVETHVRYFPVGPIYEYRWRLLDLVLAKTRAANESVVLDPFATEVTQNRGIELLQQGDIDVIALGTNAEREAGMLPIKVDILRGIVGYRIFVIREADKERIARLDASALRTELTFGLNSQWADLPVMRANGFAVETSSSYENLFAMLVAHRFDAFPRGLNEAGRELEERHDRYPQLAVEQTKAVFFPFPIYFWVKKGNTQLAQRIERGLKLAQADGSFRKLFESYHAAEIAALANARRQVVRLDNPVLPADTPPVDTSWWWR